MTTAELIEQLQRADPSGLLDVVCGNETIIGAASLPAFWDGCYQRIGFNPPSAEIVSEGTKVSLHLCNIEWLLLDYPDTEIKFDRNYAKEYFENHLKKDCEESIQIAGES